MDRILKYLEWTDRNDSKFFVRNILVPITVLLEYIYMKKYWFVVVNELLTKDKIVDWLNRQEFQLKSFYIYKKDIIQPDTFNAVSDISVATQTIEKEFVENLDNLIETNCASNIEDYFKLDVNITNINNLRVYSVYLKFWRYDIYMDKRKKFKLFSLIVGLGLVTLSTILLILGFFGII